jgi:hypothetical protein
MAKTGTAVENTDKLWHKSLPCSRLKLHACGAKGFAQT